MQPTPAAPLRSLAAVAAAALASISIAAPAQAQSHAHSNSHDTGRAANSAATAKPDAAPVDGEIRRIDRSNAKLTIRHGEIRHLDMPPMTMDFEVADKALLAPLKVGDRVRFEVDVRNGKRVVTRIEVVR